MKLFSKLLPCLLLSIITATGFAQKTDTRPALFAAYPETVSLDRSLISNAFTFQKNATVSLPFSAEFIFSGTVVTNELRYDNLQLIMIRSNENSNSLLQISKITNKDQTVVYSGMLLNSNAADAYEMKYIAGEYFLKKISSQKLFQPCNL